MKSQDLQGFWKSQVKQWLPPITLKLFKKLYEGIISTTGTQAVKRNELTPQPVLPKAALEELFPGINSKEVTIAISQIYQQHYWASPLAERLHLAAICQHIKPLRIFEIGTYTGSSTLAMAMNASAETEIFTLDLAPSIQVGNQEGSLFQVGLSYQKTPFEKQIHQLFGDTRTFDYSPFYGTVDVVFIDAVHIYEFVKKDTEEAFKMLKPGGIIIWDDYLWDERYPECAGVTRCINELSNSKKCFQVSGTRFAVHIDNSSSK